MKTIDLLSALYRVNNGSKEMIPKKIKWRSTEFNFDKKYNRYVNNNGETIGEMIPLDRFLDEEVEIIEKEKEIEKIKEIEVYHQYNECAVIDEITKKEYKGTLLEEYIIDKINELIDAVNGIRKEK